MQILGQVLPRFALRHTCVHVHLGELVTSNKSRAATPYAAATDASCCSISRAATLSIVVLLDVEYQDTDLVVPA